MCGRESSAFDAVERQAPGEPLPDDIPRLLNQLVAESTASGEIVDIYEAAGMPRPTLTDLTPSFLARALQRATRTWRSRRCARCSPRSPREPLAVERHLDTSAVAGLVRRGAPTGLAIVQTTTG